MNIFSSHVKFMIGVIWWIYLLLLLFFSVTAAHRIFPSEMAFLIVKTKTEVNKIS